MNWLILSNKLRMRQGLALLATLACLTILLSGCGAETNVKKGDQFYAIGEYFDASAEYKKAYSRTAIKDKPKRAERAWKLAECYRHINYNAKAAGAYQNALRYHYPDSLALLYLAQAQQRQGDYKNALKNYDAYLELVPGDQLATNGRLGCLQAPMWKKKPTLYTIKKEPVLNGRRSDYSPALFGDEWDQLYITTTRPQIESGEISGITGIKSADIWVSKKDEKGKWEQPTSVEGGLNSEYEEGACCFSPDGRTMYLTRCTFDAEYPRYAEIYTSTRSDASWSTPQRLQISKDTLSSYAHPAVSPDGKWLYFVSDMPGGMGGLDIFKAVCDSTGQWKVENLKYPMNSNGDDFGMTFEGLHNRGFFSTSRGDARGWDHIMSFECPEVLQTVKGWVYEKDGYELPEGLVYMVGDDGTNLKLSVRGDGSFTQEVQPHVRYVMLGTCKGYLNHKEELTVDTSSVSREYVLQFPLANINVPVLIRNVFYAFDSAELTANSTMALDSLVDLLNENPNVTIELAAHCDYRGKDEYNQRLSQRRAESVVNYLLQHGIADDRLTPVGYGESRPKVVTRKIAEQNDFLHEDDTLTEAFIKALPDTAQQEKCNALNRRTEFKVLRTTYGLFDLPVKEPKQEEGDAAKDKDKQEAANNKEASAEKKKQAGQPVQ